MSLVHAILGFLERQSMTGYDLKTRCFDGSVSYFWPADQAQVYRTLDKIVTESWAESQVQYQDDKPNRKLYTITAAGQAELRRWLEMPQSLPIHREPFLVQLFFSDVVGKDAVLGLLKQQRELHVTRLQEYEKISLQQHSDGYTQSGEIRAAMTLSLGIRMEQTYIDWIDETIHLLKA